jgi:HlyD family secretion protein
MKLKKAMIGLTVGLVVIVGAVSVYTMNQPVSVKAVKPQLMTVEDTVEETGNIGYEKTLKVYTERSGKVEKILKKLGDSVAFGEVLVRLENKTGALQIDDANAKIAAAKAQLEGTKVSNYANQKDSISLQISEAKRQNTLAEQFFEDAKSLYDSGAISQTEYKAAKDQFEMTKSQVKSLELSYSQLAKGTPAYQKKMSQAQLDQALTYREQVLYEQQLLNIASPLKGIVMEKFIDEAAMVQAGTPVMTIGDPTQVKVDVDILSDEIANLSVGDTVRMNASYLPNVVISGVVSQIAPAAKETASSLGVLQKRLPVTIKVTSHQDVLKSGLPIEVSIVKIAKENALSLPSTAFLEDESGTYVFAVAGNRLERRTVKLGIQSDQYWEVIEGVTVEDVIVASPETEMKVGQKIVFEL